MAGYIYANSAWRTLQKGFVYVNGAWKTIQNGFVYANGAWKQFFSSVQTTYTFSFGNTVHVGTNGYISLDTGQSTDSISSTVGRVLGILPANLTMNNVYWAANSSYFYVFWSGKRSSGGTNDEIQYEVRFMDGQDYAQIKLVAFPSATYSLTGYYVDGSSTGYSRITATRTVGAEYRVYFNTTVAFVSTFVEFGYDSHPVWLPSGSVTSGTTDTGYFTILASQGSYSQAPGSVTASSVTGTTATVGWTIPAREDRGMSQIQSYDYSIDSGSNWISTGASTSVNLTGLTPGNTSYTVLVRANNYYFTPGINYGTVTFSTLSNLTAPTVTSVTSGVAGGPVTVYFTGGSGPAYQMYWTSGVAPTTPVTPDASGSSSPLTDSTGPSSVGLTYYAYVRSVSTVGETSVGPSTVASDWSAGFAFTVTAAPPTITNVTASSITTSTATISWSSTDQATYSIAGLPSSPLTGTTATSRAVTGLSPSTSYTATVTLANSNGATTAASVIFTTTANPNISQIVLTPGGSSTPYMTATWTATNTASVSYSVYRSSSNALNSPVNTFITSNSTNGSSIITNSGGLNFYYQFYITPYSGANLTGTAGTQRVTGVKRNTTSGGPTTYNF